MEIFAGARKSKKKENTHTHKIEQIDCVLDLFSVDFICVFFSFSLLNFFPQLFVVDVRACVSQCDV